MEGGAAGRLPRTRLHPRCAGSQATGTQTRAGAAGAVRNGINGIEGFQHTSAANSVKAEQRPKDLALTAAIESTLTHAVRGGFLPCTACRRGVDFEVGVAWHLTD